MTKNNRTIRTWLLAGMAMAASPVLAADVTPQRLAHPPRPTVRRGSRVVRALPLALTHHWSQWTIESSDLRLPGLKSVPIV